MTADNTTAAHAMTPTAARTAWRVLPEPVRTAVEERAGVVHQATTISSGLNATFTARLDTATGPVFTKGLRADRATAQRREADINPHVQPIAPRLLWEIEVGGWHVLGFEYLDSRPADLRPGSPDLPEVTDMLRHLAALTAPDTACKRIEHRWATAANEAGADVTLLAGEHLLHTDLNPHNILMTATGVRVVDWSWPTLGAPWIDTACVALWLIAEGHTPADTERWVVRTSAWNGASVRAIDAFVTTNIALWRQIVEADPRPWKQLMHRAATRWAAHRRTGTGN